MPILALMSSQSGNGCYSRMRHDSLFSRNAQYRRLRLCLTAWIALTSSSAADWSLSRATYYGAPEQVVRAYDPTRGTGSFGIVAYGACGYTNLPKADLPFPREMYAAMADSSSDYPGSCGRCYEVRCKSGAILDNDKKPIKLSSSSDPRAKSGVLYFDGDVYRPYLASINATVKDDSGRRYPGNPTQDQGTNTVQCYDERRTLRVRVSDSCPCKQVLPDGAPGVEPGGEVRRQDWCCATQLKHFDLSYWAFQELAHPVSGAMMLETRPVDCETGTPLPEDFISPVIHSFRGIEPGWGWQPSKAIFATLNAAGKGLAGATGTCARLAAGGDMSFRSREASRPGFQPFKGKDALNFWIDGTPPIKVFLMVDDGGRQMYCFKELYLADDSPLIAATFGKWRKWTAPLSSTFQCEGALDPNELNRVDFQNVSGEEVEFCLTGIELT